MWLVEGSKYEAYVIDLITESPTVYFYLMDQLSSL